jgi:hypothetical protein
MIRSCMKLLASPAVTAMLINTRKISPLPLLPLHKNANGENKTDSKHT